MSFPLRIFVSLCLCGEFLVAFRLTSVSSVISVANRRRFLRLPQLPRGEYRRRLPKAR